MKTKNLLLAKAIFVAFYFQFLTHDAQAQINFSSAVNFAVGSQPQLNISADFNGDGKADLAVVNSQDYNISVLLGDGLGGFGTATNFMVGIDPYSIISADFNGDSKADLAVANRSDNNISVLLGDGLGSFSSAINFVTGSGTYSVISIDINGDGKLDLATANINSSDISVLLGDGLGSFSSAVNFATGFNFNPASIISADFNGDGKVDLATANNTSNNVSVLLGDGTGSFGTATNFTVGSGPCSIISADFNGDGKMDLVTANQSSNKVSVLLGNGTGGFNLATNFSVGNFPLSVISADFNGDGKLDLVSANNGSSNVSVLLGNGLGSFATAINFSVDSYSRSAISADFNGDGKADLAVVNGNDVSVLLNNTLPPSAPICLVTVDYTNTHNLVVWEKTNLNLAIIDSFIVYREISTNNYQRIGAVSKDSLSVFNDTVVNPSTTGYRYKLKIKDIHGVLSDFSDYHNTIYLTNIGANFSWTPYQVEHNTTPVATYNVYRDDNGTGNFVLIGNTTGNQFGYTDVNFSNFPNARYYVEAVMAAGSCFPTRSSFGSARSNIKAFGLNGVQQLNIAQVRVYPNPVKENLNIEGITAKTSIRLYDVVGKLVLEKVVENNTTINTSQLVNGVYFLSMEGEGVGIFNKVVIAH